MDDKTKAAAEPHSRPPVATADPGWEDAVELEVAAYIMTAWLHEIRRQRGRAVERITADDVKCLRQAQLALRLVQR
jgi:hypothetical protein